MTRETDEKGRRSIERAEPPPGFPRGRLGAGEAARLHEMADDPPAMNAALKSIPLEDQVRIYRLASRLGVDASSQEWLLHLSSGHVDRVVLRLPSEIASSAGAVASTVSSELARQGAFLASLDASVEDASEAARSASQAAAETIAACSHSSDSFARALAEAGSGRDEDIRKACAAAVEGTFAETSQAIAYQLETVRRSMSDVAKRTAARADEHSVFLEDKVAELMEESRKKLSQAAKDALKSAVAEARKTSLSSDRAEKYKAAAAACAFALLVLISGAAGYSTGSAEASKPATEARR